MIKNTIYIPASRERVFAALTDFSGYPEWVPNCEECIVVSSIGRSSGTSTTVEMCINSTRKVRMSVCFKGESGQTLEFNLVSGKELKKYSGLYRLVAAADGKGTVLFTELDLEVASIPRFLTDGSAKRSLDKGALQLKEFIEKHSEAETASAVPVSAATVLRTPIRARRLMQIVQLQLPKQYRLWFMGESVRLKNLGGNVFPGQ